MKRKLCGLAIATLTLFLLGCQKEIPAPPPQEIINRFLEEYHRFDKAPEQGEYEGSGTVEYKNSEDHLTGTANLKTKYNLKSAEDMLAELVIMLEGKGKVGQQAGEVDLEAVLQVANQNTAYLTVNKVEIATDDPQVNQVIALIASLYKEKILSFQLPQSLKESLKKGTRLTIPDETLPEETMRQIAMENPFLKLAEVVDSKEQIYGVKIDVPVLKNYLKAFAKAGATEMSEEELSAYDEIEKTTKYDVQIDIGEAPDYRLEGIKGNISFHAGTIAESDGTVKFDIKTSQKKSSGTIELEITETGKDPLTLSVNFSSSSKESAIFSWSPDKLKAVAEPFDLLNLLGGVANSPDYEDLE